MFSRKGVFWSVGRPTMMAAVAALALTAIEPTMALAGSAPKGLSAAPAHGITDVSSRARVYRRGGGGGAAAAAAFAGIVGTGLAIAASQNRGYNSYDGYYGGGPAYYAPGPRYYGGDNYGGYGDQSRVPYIDPNAGGW